MKWHKYRHPNGTVKFQKSYSVDLPKFYKSKKTVIKSDPRKHEYNRR